MNHIERRICALESANKPVEGQLPTLVDDDTPDTELERLRRGGLVVMRFSEFLEIAI